MATQRAVYGFTFRHPDGSLCPNVSQTVAGAQNGAAFASDRPYSHVSWPSDWRRAYKQGFRIVPVKLVTTGKSRAAWKNNQEAA